MIKIKKQILLFGIIFALLFSFWFVLRKFDCQIKGIGKDEGFFKGRYNICYTAKPAIPCAGTSYYVSVADYDSFYIFDQNRSYAKDKHNVYYPKKIYDYCKIVSLDVNNTIEKADINSFEILDYGWAKDNNSVFYYDLKVEGADSKTFLVIDENHAQDIGYKYKNGKILDQEETSENTESEISTSTDEVIEE